jgi:hybrid cluster-associated redox disulfide protein
MEGNIMDWGKMTISEVLNTHPQAVQILQQAGVGCLGCFMAHSENLEDGLRAHGLDVDSIVKKLDETYEK